MTAWEVGYNRKDFAALDAGGLGAYIGKVIGWIPADVVAIYGLAVTAMQPHGQDPGSNPNLAWLIIFVALTPIVSWLGALASNRPFTWQDLAAGVLALLAFAIWSTGVPQSGWGRINAFANNPVNLAIGAAIAGVIFSLLATFLIKVIPNKPIRKS